MSRLGKKPIEIPADTEVRFDAGAGRAGTLYIKGKLGELVVPVLSDIKVVIENNVISISTARGIKQARANWGTMSSLVKSAIKGVNEGFTKVLEFKGVGFRATLEGEKLVLNLGYSHPVTYVPPKDVKVTTEKNTITVTGIHKAVVGQAAADIRKLRKPEPYKGTGIKYQDEVIRRKAGKKAVGATPGA